MRSGFVEVDRHRIRYHEYGDGGPRVVLLHGFGHINHSLNFRDFLENMSNSYRVLALDLLGHGKSSDPVNLTGFEQHARIIHHAAVKLGYARYSLIGYSFGGRVSMRLASLYGESIERLVIVDIAPITFAPTQQVKTEPGVPFSFNDAESAVDWISGRASDVPRAYWYGKMDNLFFREEDGAWGVSSHPTRKTMLVQDGDGWGIFKKISVPTMLIRGSESNSSVEEEVYKMSALMDDLRVDTIEGAGHNVPFTHGDQFERAIREFIQP